MDPVLRFFFRHFDCFSSFCVSEIGSYTIRVFWVWEGLFHSLFPFAEKTCSIFCLPFHFDSDSMRLPVSFFLCRWCVVVRVLLGVSVVVYTTFSLAPCLSLMQKKKKDSNLQKEMDTVFAERVCERHRQLRRWIMN